MPRSDHSGNRDLAGPEPARGGPRGSGVLRWSTVVLVAVGAVVVGAGWLPLGAAVGVFVVLEVGLWLAFAGQALVAVRAYRAERNTGRAVGEALDAAARVALPAPVAFVVRHEVLLVASLGRWLLRRPDVPASATPIRYDRAQRAVGVLFLVLAVAELVAVEVIVPWDTVRLVLLVLGGWTLLMVLALIGGNVVRPHLVTPGELRLRWGDWLDVRVPADRIASVAARHRSATASGWHVDGDTLALAISGETTVEVTLTGPVTVTSGRRTATVHIVRFVADDPQAAVTAISSAYLRT